MEHQRKRKHYGGHCVLNVCDRRGYRRELEENRRNPVRQSVSRKVPNVVGTLSEMEPGQTIHGSAEDLAGIAHLNPEPEDEVPLDEVVDVVEEAELFAASLEDGVGLLTKKKEAISVRGARLRRSWRQTDRILHDVAQAAIVVVWFNRRCSQRQTLVQETMKSASRRG